ncbi:MAG TPA: GntR family transcriptional regulator, partial [Chloroflexota bacterium]|nr:GntR family transcriptional regulator [Chloroflexota bacterium]
RSHMMAIGIQHEEILPLDENPKASASEQTYQLLKRLIIRLELPPGAVLSESFLIQRLNLGRTPLREALQRLAQDRLVVILPRRGILISDISIADLQSIFEVRADLEALCGRLATQRITDEQIEAMEKLFEGIESTGDVDEDVDIDQSFHRLLLKAAANPHLEDMLSRIHCLSLRLLYLSQSRMTRVQEGYEDYRRVIQALKTRDADAVQLALREHVNAFYGKVRKTF